MSEANIEVKRDHPDDHAEDCGCSICTTRRSWLAMENAALLPPQVEIEELAKKVEDAEEGHTGEKLAKPTPKPSMKRKMTNSPSNSETNETLSRKPTDKKDSTNKRQKKDLPSQHPRVPKPSQSTTHQPIKPQPPPTKNSSNIPLNPSNKSSNPPVPSVPKPNKADTQQTAKPIAPLPNPQILSQVLTMMRAEIVQEIRGLHLDLYNNLSKRMSNMEKLLVQIAKSHANQTQSQIQPDRPRPEEATFEHPTPSHQQQADSDDQERMNIDDWATQSSSASSIEKGKMRTKVKTRRRRGPKLQRISDIRNRKDETLHSKDEPLHFHFLKEEFTKRFGLPVTSGKRRKISSFDGVVLANGYEEVVTTWQGMFFQLSGEDVAFENMSKYSTEKSSKVTYRTKGVTVFKLLTPDTKATPLPHRFAVKPPPTHTGPCNPLLPGKWYVHVYQTKVETSPNIFAILPSKSMARQLERICGTDYLPRDWDLKTPPTNQPRNTDPESAQLQQTKPRTTIPSQHHQHLPNQTFYTLPAYPPGFRFQPINTWNPNLTNQFNQIQQNPYTWHNITNTRQPYQQNQSLCLPVAQPMSTNIFNRTSGNELNEQNHQGIVGRPL